MRKIKLYEKPRQKQREKDVYLSPGPVKLWWQPSAGMGSEQRNSSHTNLTALSSLSSAGGKTTDDLGYLAE